MKKKLTWTIMSLFIIVLLSTVTTLLTPYVNSIYGDTDTTDTTDKDSTTVHDVQDTSTVEEDAITSKLNPFFSTTETFKNFVVEKVIEPIFGTQGGQSSTTSVPSPTTTTPTTGETTIAPEPTPTPSSGSDAGIDLSIPLIVVGGILTLIFILNFFVALVSSAIVFIILAVYWLFTLIFMKVFGA